MVFECGASLVNEGERVLVIVLGDPIAVFFAKLLEGTVGCLAPSLEIGFPALGPGVDGP